MIDGGPCVGGIRICTQHLLDGWKSVGPVHGEVDEALFVGGGGGGGEGESETGGGRGKEDAGSRRERAAAEI